ncbi:MAG: hypothetical protein DWQ07_24240 [Chloroflexi bacterium]|nr:MAG: hypothetical protein DWQ07_24240 [Chloroflexota bacterium]MBL1196244.1 hypothetical protein [Chloroflexota bacterium]NOH13539.1 hypothetical protein [Chloroflexota bacterium]
MENKQGTTYQEAPRRSSALNIGVIILVVLLLLVVIGGVGLFALRSTAGGVANLAEGASQQLETVGEVAGDVANAADIGGEQIADPDRFMRVQGEYVLHPGDFDFPYYVEAGKEVRLANSTLVLEVGQVEGKGYINDTGRVDGWRLEMRRQNSADFTPAIIVSSVEVFETIGGAQLALTPDYFHAYEAPDGYDLISSESCSIGDECTLIVLDRFDAAASLTTLRYDVAFTYHNILVWVSGRGLDVEINENDVLEPAQMLLERLQNGVDLVAAN